MNKKIRFVFQDIRHRCRRLRRNPGVTLPAALAAGRLLENLLYGLPPGNPLTILVVLGFLPAVGLLAAYGPGRPASRIHSVTALTFD
jgi:hypothetical protein